MFIQVILARIFLIRKARLSPKLSKSSRQRCASLKVFAIVAVRGSCPHSNVQFTIYILTSENFERIYWISFQSYPEKLSFVDQLLHILRLWQIPQVARTHSPVIKMLMFIFQWNTFRSLLFHFGRSRRLVSTFCKIYRLNRRRKNNKNFFQSPSLLSQPFLSALCC